jgi:hypothetical protein
MFNVYKNQPSRQTGSRNLMVPKTLPTIWHTYVKLEVTSTRLPILDVIIPPLPEGGGCILFYLCPSVLPKYFSSNFCSTRQLLQNNMGLIIYLEGRKQIFRHHRNHIFLFSGEVANLIKTR